MKEKKKKLFISIPMSGRSEEDIDKEMKNIASIYKSKGYEIIDSFLDMIDGDRTYNLGKSISILNDADYVVFAPGWDRSRGCQIEKFVCDMYGFDYEFYNQKYESIERVELATNTFKNLDIIKSLNRKPGNYQFLFKGSSSDIGIWADNDHGLISIESNEIIDKYFDTEKYDNEEED